MTAFTNTNDFKPLPTSWSGYTVFPLQKDETDGPVLPQPALTPDDYKLTADQLRPDAPPGLSKDDTTSSTSPTTTTNPNLTETTPKLRESTPLEPPSVEPTDSGTVTDAMPTAPEPSLNAKPARGMKAPTMPSATEVTTHNLTHMPYRDWCPHCVAGQGKELQHRQLTDRHPTFQLDYQFLTQAKRQLQPGEEPNDSNTHYTTVLCAVDTAS